MEESFVIIVILILIIVCILLCCLQWSKTKNFGGKVENLQVPPQLTGPLAPNNHLSDLVLLLENQIDGPESLLIEDGTIYTGTNDAKIVKIVNGNIEKYLHLIETGNLKKGTYASEPKTGRPLGLRRLNKDCLVVADSYLGVFKVDFEKAVVTKLYPANLKIDGKPSRFLNDVEVVDGTRIFVTDSSTSYSRRDFTNALLENAANGRYKNVGPIEV